MSIPLDHGKARQILLEEVQLARSAHQEEVVHAWKARVAHLGELCPHHKSATVIAALGTAILAKATDVRVDVYALLDRGEGDNSYSARSLADDVWARNRAQLKIDLGANGVNPLNNTPFIGKTRIDEITGVRNQAGWRCFLECMEALKEVQTANEAKLALRGFILARSRELLAPMVINPRAGDDLTCAELVEAIDEYVSQQSEGGRRAQACAAGILDATYGDAQVLVGVINDPDRRAPLDVCVTGSNGAYQLALEVKDKPIEGYHVQSSIEKTVAKHKVTNFGFLAVSKQQTEMGFGDAVHWAAERGLKATVFLSWSAFFSACKFFAPCSPDIFEGRAFRRILVRAAELQVETEPLEVFKARSTFNNIVESTGNAP